MGNKPPLMGLREAAHLATEESGITTWEPVADVVDGMVMFHPAHGEKIVMGVGPIIVHRGLNMVMVLGSVPDTTPGVWPWGDPRIRRVEWNRP